jgi:hypothetical protein
VDCVAAIPAFGAADPKTSDIVFTLPAAPLGLTQPEPPLVIGVQAAPGVAVVQGDVVIGVQVMDLDGGGPGPGAGLAVGMVIRWAKVTTAGGPGVGQITVRIDDVATAITVAVLAATFRFFLLR